jgi:hypothetical protein
VFGHVHVHEKHCFYKIDCRLNPSSLPKISCAKKRRVLRRVNNVSVDDLRGVEDRQSNHANQSVKLVLIIRKSTGAALYVKKGIEKISGAKINTNISSSAF